MKAIQNCLQKIVIYKIYSLEKQKMEYNAYSGGYPFSISGDIRSVPS